MTTFLKWYQGRVSGAPSKDWIYAHGDTTLVTEVEDYVRRPARFGSTPMVVEPVDGAGLTWARLSTLLSGGSLYRTQHLLVIRDGEKVDGDVWQELLIWYRRSDPIKRLSRNILVTSYERFNARDHDDPRYLPFVKAEWAHHIDCRLQPDRLPEYAELKLGLGRARGSLGAIATEIAARSGGSLVRLRAECEKLMIYCGADPITMDAVDTVVTPSPGEAFVEALSYGRRTEAAARAPYVGSLRATLGLLEWHVQTLYLIHFAKSEIPRMRRVPYGRIADRIGVPVFQVQRLERRATAFDAATTRRRMGAIVRAYRDLPSAVHPEWALLPLVARW